MSDFNSAIFHEDSLGPWKFERRLEKHDPQRIWWRNNGPYSWLPTQQDYGPERCLLIAHSGRDNRLATDVDETEATVIIAAIRCSFGEVSVQ